MCSHTAFFKFIFTPSYFCGTFHHRIWKARAKAKERRNRHHVGFRLICCNFEGRLPAFHRLRIMMTRMKQLPQWDTTALTGGGRTRENVLGGEVLRYVKSATCWECHYVTQPSLDKR